MEGKTCLITGTTAGIGKEAARELARLGATVVVAGRNPAKCQATVQEIQQQTGNNNVDFLVADLSSLEEVRRLAQEFKGRHDRLDVLVNNAGAIMLSRKQSVDGFEMTFALNHLNYFLLTDLLLDLLKASAPSRIVNVSSASHRKARMDFQDLQGQRRFRGSQAYGRSKLANLLFTYELARRLEGTGVTANGLHPGLVATNFMANNGRVGRFLNIFVRLIGRSVEVGAQTIIYLASSPDVEGITGQYFVDQNAVPSSQASYDRDDASRLWEVSSELAGLAVGEGS